MIVTIKYKAKLSWDIYEDVMCDVVHEIDDFTLQTTKFDYTPIPGYQA